MRITAKHVMAAGGPFGRASIALAAAALACLPSGEVMLLAGIAVACVGGIAARLAARMRRAEARAAALEAALEHMNQGLTMIDDRGMLSVINRRAADMLGLPERFLDGNASFAEVAEHQLAEYGAVDPKMLEMVVASSLSMGFSTTERTRPNGMVIEVDNVPFGKGFIRTYLDVTERRKVQAELAKAKEKAEADARAKEAFFAMMSHEMRTPLNGVIGLAEVLADADLGPAERRHVQILQDSATHLLKIINDILDFSKMHSDKAAFRLESAPFDLERAVDSAVGTVVSAARNKGIAIAAEIGPDVPRHLIGDAARLKQVLLNLVGNAVKFTSVGRVDVSVSAERSDEDSVDLRVRVADTGIGIPKEALPKLFGAFSQVDASISRRYGGTGLGLAISQEIVKAMGSRIEVSSEPGRGTTFEFVVTMPRGRGAVPVRRTGAVAPIGARRILLVDDNETNRIVGEALLQRMGHAVDLACDGHQAVAAVQGATYDVVLMDVMMPELDGLSATREIRALSGPASEVTILALTANALERDVESVLAAGMDGVVPKPVTRSGLERALARALVGDDQEPEAAPSATSPSPAPDVPVLDRAVLDEFLAEVGPEGGDRMMEMFVQNTQASIRGLAKVARDAAALERFAHSLKSSAGIFGFARLARTAADLEAEAGRGVYPEGSIESLDAALEEARREVKAA